MKTTTVLPVMILIAFLGMSATFYVPSDETIAQIDPNQMGYLSLLQNPIVYLLMSLSLIIMFAGFNHVINKLLWEGKATLLSSINRLMIILMTCIAVIILSVNWVYISSNFTTFISMIIYESFNPHASPNMDYQQWKYNLTPAKAIAYLILIPVFLPFFYYLMKIKRRNK